MNKLRTEGVDENAFQKAKQTVKENLQQEMKTEHFLKTIGLYEIITVEEVSAAAKE